MPQREKMMDLRITDQIQEKDRAAVLQGLSDYNMARIEDKHPRNLGIYLDDSKGNVQAGLLGFTLGYWLMVQYLWVAEGYRGQEIGSTILRQAETEARARGCKYAFLDTCSFQAPEFYKKYGYREVLTLDEFPLTGKRYYYTKEL